MSPATIALIEMLVAEIGKIIAAERAGSPVSAADVIANIATHEQSVAAAHAAAAAAEDAKFGKAP